MLAESKLAKREFIYLYCCLGRSFEPVPSAAVEAQFPEDHEAGSDQFPGLHDSEPWIQGLVGAAGLGCRLVVVVTALEIRREKIIVKILASP